MTARERDSHGLKHPLDLSLLQETQESFCFLPNPHCREWGGSRTATETQPCSRSRQRQAPLYTPYSKHQRGILASAAPPHATEQRQHWARQKVSPGTKTLQPIAGGRSARTANATAVSFSLRGCQGARSHRPQPAASQTKLPRNGVIVAMQTKDMTSGHWAGQQPEG